MKPPPAFAQSGDGLRPSPKGPGKAWHWIAVYSAVVGLGLGAIVIGIFLWSWFAPAAEPIGRRQLAAWFENEFGQKPPPGVEALEARIMGVGDSEVRSFRLKVNPAFVSSLLQRGFTHNTQGENRILGAREDEPVWWKPAADGISDFYYTSEWWLKRSKTGSNDASLGINRDQTLLYFKATSSF